MARRPDQGSRSANEGVARRALMWGTGGWKPRSLALLAGLCLSLAALIPVFPHLPTFRPENQVLTRRDGRVVDSGLRSKIGELEVDLSDGSRLSLPRPFAANGPLEAQLRSGRELGFLITQRCHSRGAAERCQIWAVLTGSDTLLSAEDVYATELEAGLPYLGALALFFGLMGGVGAYQAVHGKRRTGSWTTPIPSSTADTAVRALSLDDVAAPEAMLRLVVEAQRELKEADRRVTYGALAVCALAFVALRVTPESWWNQPVTPTGVFGVIGGGALVLGVGDVLRQARTRFWRSTPCWVLHTTVLAKDNGFVPAVFFDYEAGGAARRSWRVQITGPQTTLDKAHELSDRYRVGRETRCFVNPSDPSQAVLDRRLNLVGAKLAAAFVVGSASLGWLLS